MRTKQERRYLTERYQFKQARLRRQFWGPYADTNRRPEIALIYKLCGFNPWDHYTDAPSAEMLGRWRNHSWRDCGYSRCPHCSNPRRGNTVWASSRKTWQTRAENVADINYIEQLNEYYTI